MFPETEMLNRDRSESAIRLDLCASSAKIIDSVAVRVPAESSSKIDTSDASSAYIDNRHRSPSGRT